MMLFYYPRVILSLPFRSILTGLGVDCIRRFLLHNFPYHPLHLRTRIPLPLPQNLSPHRALHHIPLPFPRHICPPRAPLSLYLTLPLPQNLSPPHAPLSIPLSLPHHLGPPRAPLYISLPLHITWPPCLSQNSTRCHSYPKMSQVIQCI